MRTETYPLAVPEDLLKEIRKTAKATGLSLADAMRQSMRLGLPKLKAQLAIDKLKPFSADECREAFGEPNPEFDPLEAHLAKLPVPMPEE